MSGEREILRPRPLKTGDRVAIVSPAGIIKPQTVYRAMPVLTDCGWVTYAGAHAFDREGTYAGSDDARYSDLEEALLDPETRAIVCSRGGYGAVHLLERLNRLPLRDDPKWIVGYSDISALHALMTRHGIVSLHAPMAKHIQERNGKDEDSQRLFSLLRGGSPDISFPGHPLNIAGKGEGVLAGGNLAVIADLISTPYDVIRPGRILFIEDIAEPIYKVERIIYQLRLSGALGVLSGLVVGQFTDYAADPNADTMEEMIWRLTADLGIPVAFGVPVGHVSHNVPLPCSMPATLSVGTDGASLTFA